ncbi:MULTISPECIES: DUF6448 family protein [unclassified Kribbella]|uniref:DUF6448 family protein n=1 Tax=unclassified Kribbella TaxID=2644121 RepID=UPI00307780D4
MPPHCDSLDGPVVTAARAALDQGKVDVVLPYVAADGEEEVRQAFALVLKARAHGPESREVADRWFFETVVRIHRAGEGAPFTGLKPAGLDVGPVIPAAERAITLGSAQPLEDALCDIVRQQVELRHARVMALEEQAHSSLPGARDYVEAMLGLQVWAHRLYKQALADHPHRPSHTEPS